MQKISTAIPHDFEKLQNNIRAAIKTVDSFEEAAQIYTTTIYEAFKDSIVLVRLFATVPYGQLPPQNKTFVSDLAMSKGIHQLMHDETLVLSLLGTCGAQTNWNSRRTSQGHIGIPLVSTEFIDAIPMMSRLLKQLGLGLEWIGSHDTQLVTHTLGSMSGVFFVPEAMNEIDSKGRKIIVAQDFVTDNHVKTVFGYGGGYVGTKTFTVTILFLQETITKHHANKFAGAMAFFKPLTVNLVKKKIFTE